jgi:uncharacterized membrane protein YphA (DoxX/SURF4 family)
MSGRPADSLSAPASERPARRRGLTLLDAACRYLAATVFLMAAVTKITAPQTFSDQLVLHSSLPLWLSLTVAAALPWLELVCGFCFLSGAGMREAAFVGAVMVLAFTVYLLVQRPETDCGCLVFPAALPPALRLPSAILRNAVLLTCCLRLAACAKPASLRS